MKPLHYGLLLAGLLAFGVAAAGPDAVQPAFKLNIAAQPIDDALHELGRQSGLQIFFASDEGKGITTPRLVGTFTVRDALTKLLHKTGLRYEYIDERTVAIRVSRPGLEDGAGVSSRSGQDAGAGGDALRLTRVESGQQSGLARAEASVEEAAQGADTTAGAAGGSRGIPEMLVKGRRSSNTDIRRSEDDVQPYVVFEAEEIQRSMAGDLEAFLLSRLPMNASAGTSSQSEVFNRGNRSSIDLRGLGEDQTLILVNGRRMPGVSTGSDFNQPDINGIPLSSVERIEVLPSTAGGIYGGGATGGVINVVLKSDYRGIEVNARYDNAFNTDVAQRRLEGSAGFSLEGGKTHIMFAASHTDSNLLQTGERDFLQRARALQQQNNSAVFDGFSPPAGATANIRSADGADLVLAATGQSLGSAITSVPYGYGGPTADGGSGLLANAGRYNLDLPDSLQGLRRSLTSNPTISSASINLRRRFSDRIEAFVDSAYYGNKSHSNYGGFPVSAITVAEGAPSNPFQQAIRVQFPASDFSYGGDVDTESQTLKIGGGVMVRLPHEWTLQAGYDWGRSRYRDSYSLFVFTDDGRAALSDGRLDILRDVEAHPLDYSPYYFTPSPNQRFPTPRETVLTDATLRLAGPVLALPGGSIVFSTLLERREQELQASVRELNIFPDTPNYSYYPSRGQKTDSAYVEVTAPLISATNARRLARALDLQASYRRDETSTTAVQDTSVSSFGVPSPQGPFPDVPYAVNRVQANQYTLGLRYQPVESAALRVSYGAGILPPSLSHLVPRIQFNYSVPLTLDPKRDNTPVGVVQEYRSGGSQDLVPEQSRSWSAGIIFTPDFLPGLRLTADYTRIRKADEIANIARQTLFDLEDRFPGRIVRAELTAADQAQDYTGGEIQSIDAGRVNLAHSELEACDIQIDYRWDTAYGMFRANVIATYTSHLKLQVLEGSPARDWVGFTGGPLQWRGNGGLSWDRGAWAASWNMQYYDSYLVYSATTSDFLRDNLILNQGSSVIPDQIYHDLFVKYRFDDASGFGGGVLANGEVALGIANVFDTSPPILATSATIANGYSTYGDPRLRRYSLALTRRF